MAQDQHFLPQVYLRQWCIGEHLFRYRRVGPHEKLVADRKVPKGVGFEVDLYTLPRGTAANGLTGDEVESTLARNVDERIRAIVEATANVSGEVTDATTRADIIWLAQTFVARSPETIRRVEVAVAEFVDGQRVTIEKLTARAKLTSTQSELRSLLDERRPRVAALAGVAAIATEGLPVDTTWLDGDVHAIRREVVEGALRAIGSDAFVTFEQPVVEWESPSSGLMASFSLSPEVLVLVFAKGSVPEQGDYVEVVLRHSLLPLRTRRNLFCRAKVTGALLEAAAELVPTPIPP